MDRILLNAPLCGARSCDDQRDDGRQVKKSRRHHAHYARQCALLLVSSSSYEIYKTHFENPI